MSARLTFGLFLALGTISSGCDATDASSSGLETADGYEGDEEGECTNQADDDRDGYFDCQDNGCWGHPACDGGSTGAGTGGATDGGPTGGPTGSNTGTETGNATGSTTGTTTGVTSCDAPLCDITSFRNCGLLID